MKVRQRRKQNLLKQVDWILLGLVFAIIIFGLVAIINVTSTDFTDEELTFWQQVERLNFSSANLQMVYVAVGVGIMAVVMCIDYNNLRDFTNLIYWCCVGVLVLVLFFGKNVNGTTGWFQFGNRGFQPAEVCKVVLIVVLAREFALRTEGGTRGIATFKELFPLLWRILIPVVLIFLQPDWGTALVYVFIFAGMMFMARTSFRLIGYLLLGIGVLAPVPWFLMRDYQHERILNFLDPMRDMEGSGYNVAQAKSVIQAGGIQGKGFFSPELLTQDSSYLPEDHTDFIFSSASEAMGFWGGLVLLLLYFALLARMVILAMRARDDFGSYIILGVCFMMFFHIVINIGMNIGVMPVTGIPLPLFSYGGSYMLTSFVAIGLVLNVNMRRPRLSI